MRECAAPVHMCICVSICVVCALHADSGGTALSQVFDAAINNQKPFLLARMNHPCASSVGSIKGWLQTCELKSSLEEDTQPLKRVTVSLFSFFRPEEELNRCPVCSLMIKKSNLLSAWDCTAHPDACVKGVLILQPYKGL